MPELPEVEFARKTLHRAIHGATVDAVKVQDARVVRPSSRALHAARGRRVVKVERRGKWLRALLDDGSMLLSHLGMTGKWLARPSTSPEERFERVRLDVTKQGRKSSVRYVDPRMFGKLVFAREEPKTWSALGPDPLVDGIDVDALAKALHARKRAIKEVLMDQSLLAGVGNIVATEALWRAKVDPRSRSQSLGLAQVRAIARGIEGVIRDAIARYGARSITYVEEAGAPNPYPIYGKKGSPCPRCKTTLTKIVLAGRGTTFCPNCQL
jgi:formamidopyrimidine-DNA glycosylase